MMAAIPARRKYGTCFLRIRENCPFRKLRKNRYDVSAAASSGVGVVFWNTPITQPTTSQPITTTPANDRPIDSVYSQAASTNQNVYITHQSQAAVAMDTGMAPPPAPPPVVIGGGINRLNASGLAAEHGFRPQQQQHGPRPQPSSHQQQDHYGDSMELDGGVDPETGERAQG